MVEEDRYCVDISNQLMATQAILKRANKEIIGAHMKHIPPIPLNAGGIQTAVIPIECENIRLLLYMFF